MKIVTITSYHDSHVAIYGYIYSRADQRIALFRFGNGDSSIMLSLDLVGLFLQFPRVGSVATERCILNDMVFFRN